MKTRRLTESAMLIALAVVLEILGKTLIPPMPFGGQLTIVSMLPIVLISYRHGVKWGLVSGFGYSLAKGVEQAVDNYGLLGAFLGGLRATAGGIAAAIGFAILFACFVKPRDK